MSSDQTTPVLTNNVPNEEKFQIPPRNIGNKIGMIFCLIFLCIFGVVMCAMTFNGGGGFFGLIFVAVGIVMVIVTCCKTDGSAVTINNINHTLKLERTSLCCGGDSPKILDLNQIAKMNIISQGIERGVLSGGNQMPENIPISSYIITYNNGMTEDVSNYFNDRDQNSLVNCQNFLRKYINIEIGVPFYQQGVPGYNPNINAINNNYQQSYDANVNVYSINNDSVNQNIPVQQNLACQDEASKPQSNDNCGAPTVAQ